MIDISSGSGLYENELHYGTIHKFLTRESAEVYTKYYAMHDATIVTLPYYDNPSVHYVYVIVKRVPHYIYMRKDGRFA